MKKNFLAFFLILIFLIPLPCYSLGNPGATVKSTNFDYPIETVTWMPDGKSYITSNGNSLVLWDSKTDKIIDTKKDYDGQILTAKVSPDGVSLFTLYDDNTFIVQDIVHKKYFTTQKGLSDIPVFDGVFVDDYFTMLLPMDGQNIYSFFCLLHTNQALVEEKIQSDAYVYGLDVDKSGKHLLITFSDGTIRLLDLETKKVIQETKSHSVVSITSEFSPDGNYYTYQVDQDTIRVQSLISSIGYTIKDFDHPVNTLDYSPNGKSIAIGDQNGYVKIYNIAKGYVEDALLLDEGDIAFSCEFSPDGKSLIIGTKNGNVIRWEPRFTTKGQVPGTINNSGVVNQIIVIEDDGREHPGTQRVQNDPNSNVEGIKIIEKQATDEDVGEYITIAPTNPLSKLFKKNINLNPHNIFATVGLGTINSQNFWGNLKFEAGYLNYKPFPFYWGGSFGLDIGFTSDKFPYHYQVGKEDIGKPIMYGFSPAAIGGFHILFEKPGILTFAEIGLGVNIRTLASSNLKYPYAGPAAVSFFSELALGAEWKFLRAEFDVMLDTNFIWAVSGSVGAVIKLPSKNRNIQNPGGSN